MSAYCVAQGTRLSPLLGLYGKRILKIVDVCVWITDSLCCTPEANATL